MGSQINPFRSFFMGGFECSTHRRRGTRLDLIKSTRHDELASSDYRTLRDLGLVTMRDGLRWHLIERSPGLYDWSSLQSQISASVETDVQIVWDLCHYGWPRGLDIWSPIFVERFASYCAAAARVIGAASPAPAIYCPVNEISYWAWAGAHAGLMDPAVRGRAGELKRQLVRAAIAGMRAIKLVDPNARFASAEPLINVSFEQANKREEALSFNQAQYEACDLMAGILEPEAGGSSEYLDLIGLNFYPNNQWYIGGSTIPLGHHAYRPLSDMIADVYERYRRPIFISETGAEGSARAAWLYYVCGEVRDASERGIPILGICLYPVLDYPGWDNYRCCSTGLLSLPDKHGRRRVSSRYAGELARQRMLMELDRQPRS